MSSFVLTQSFRKPQLYLHDYELEINRETYYFRYNIKITILSRVNDIFDPYAIYDKSNLIITLLYGKNLPLIWMIKFVVSSISGAFILHTNKGSRCSNRITFIQCNYFIGLVINYNLYIELIWIIEYFCSQ